MVECAVSELDFQPPKSKSSSKIPISLVEREDKLVWLHSKDGKLSVKVPTMLTEK